MSSPLPTADNSNMSYYDTPSASVQIDALTKRQVNEYQKEAFWRTHCEWSGRIREERNKVEDDQRLRDLTSTTQKLSNYDQIRLSNLDARLLFSEGTELPRKESAECGRLKQKKKILIGSDKDETLRKDEEKAAVFEEVEPTEEEAQEGVRSDSNIQLVQALETLPVRCIDLGKILEQCREVKVRCMEFKDILDKEIAEGISHASMAASTLSIAQMEHTSKSSPITASIPSTPFEVSNSGMTPLKRRPKLAKASLATATPQSGTLPNPVGPLSLKGIALPLLPAVSPVLKFISNSSPMQSSAAQPDGHSVHSYDTSLPSSPIILPIEASRIPTRTDLDFDPDILLSTPLRIPFLARTPSLSPMSSPLKRKFSSISYGLDVDDSSLSGFGSSPSPSLTLQKLGFSTAIEENQRHKSVCSRKSSKIEIRTASEGRSGLREFSSADSQPGRESSSSFKSHTLIPNSNSQTTPTPMLRRESAARSTSRQYSRHKSARIFPQTLDKVESDGFLLLDRMLDLEEGQEILQG